MANPIKYVELFEEQLQSQINALNKEMKELNATMESIVAKAGNVSKAMKATTPTTKDSQSAISQLAKEVNGLKFQYDDLNSKLKEDASDVALLAQKKRELTYLVKQETIAQKSAEGSYNALNAEYKKLVAEINATTEGQRVGNKTWKEAQQEANRLYQELKRLDAEVGKNQRNVGNYKSALDGVGLSMKDLGNSVKSVAARFVGWAAIIQTTIKGLKDAFNTIVEFEKNLSSLRAVVGSSGKSMAELSTQAIALARNTRYTANEIVDLQLAMAKLGLTANEIKAATKAVADFALATGSNTAEAAQLAVNALNIFGASAQEIDRYVSVMAISTYRSALNFGYLQTSLSTVAPVANAFGFSIEDTIALLGALADSGFSASLAATATRNILLKLADANGELAQALGRPATNLDELIEGLKELDAKGINLAQSFDLVGQRSVSAFNSFLEGADHVRTLRESITDVNDEFMESARIMNDNVAGSIKNIQSSWDALILTFQNSKGAIKDVLDYIDRAIGGLNFLLAKSKDWTNQEASVKSFDLSGALKSAKSSYANVYNQLIGKGYSSERAEQEARASAKENLEKRLDYYTKLLKKAEKKLEPVANKGILSALFSTGKRSSALGRKIEYSAEVSSLKSVVNAYTQALEEIENYTLDVVGNGESTYTPPTDPKEAARQAKQEQAERERQVRARISELKREFKARKDAEEEYIKAEYKGQEQEIKLAEWRKKFGQEEIDLNLEINRISIEGLKDYKGYSEKTLQAMEKSKVHIVEQGELEIIEINEKYAIKALDIQQKTTELQLKAARKGSLEEYSLQVEKLERQREIDIAKNNLLGLQGQPHETEQDILNAYYRNRLTLEEQFVTAQVKLNQQLEDSRFELVEHSDNEIYKNKVRHEIELLQLKRAFLKQDPQASEKEIEIIDNQIKKLMKDLNTGQIKSIWDALGLDLSADDQKNLEQSIGYLVDAITEITDAQVEAAERVVEARQKEVDAAQKALDAELEARANGYANNVTLARKELEEKKKLQRQALNDQRKAQRQQAAIQTLEQIGNLVTATSLLWKQTGILAPIAIATMWASFAASKIIAANMATKADNEEQYGHGTIEYLRGGSHQSGNDIDLGTKADGTRRKAEGGETFAIINKRNTRKYGGLIPSVINALNEGTFLQKYGNNLDGDGTIALSVIGGGTTDLSNLERNVEQIAEQGARKEYVDSNGNTIVTYKNLKTIIKS